MYIIHVSVLPVMGQYQGNATLHQDPHQPERCNEEVWRTHWAYDAPPALTLPEDVLWGCATALIGALTPDLRAGRRHV
jgi:hypothetical protein